MFGRKRKDERAWREVDAHKLSAYLDRPLPRRDWESQTLAGWVMRVYQRSSRGTKVLVGLGDLVKWIPGGRAPSRAPTVWS